MNNVSFENKSKLTIILDGKELIEKIRETHTVIFGDYVALFSIDNLPILIKHDEYDSMVKNINEQSVYRICLAKNDSRYERYKRYKKENPFWSIYKIYVWCEDVDMKYVELNLEALDLFRDILVRNELWCKIYNNPGKDWSEEYLKLGLI